MYFIKIPIVFLFSLLTISIPALSQEKKTDKNYKQNPVWIEMMADSNVNFYEATKAYEIFWKYNQQKDEIEEEEMTKLSNDKIEERKKELNNKKAKNTRSAKDRKELVNKEYLAYQNKRFKGWVMEVKPFVQEDGRILTPRERMNIAEPKK